MAFDTKKLEKQALELIQSKRLFFIEDVVAFLPCTKGTFYNHKLHELDSIKTALETNIIEVKSSMRNKWYKSDNATLQVALMKLLASDVERKKLSQQYHDLTTGGDKLPTPILQGITPMEILDDEVHTDDSSSEATDTQEQS